MLEQEVSIEYIERVFGEGTLSNGGQNIAVICPFCIKTKGKDYSKRKLVIRTDTHLNHCWVCEFKSKNLHYIIRSLVNEKGIDLLAEYEQKLLPLLPSYKKSADIGLIFDYFDDVEQAQIVEVTIPKDAVLVSEIYKQKTLDKYSAAHIKYLDHRGLLNEEDLWRWNFMITSKENKEYAYRVLMPSFDKEGNVNFIVARSIFENTYIKYLNSLVPKTSFIFNEHLINWNKPLWLVEGPFDMVKFRTITTNVCPMLGKTLSEDFLLFKQIAKHKTPVILALDPGEYRSTIKIATFLNGYGVEVFVLNYKKPIEDIGSLSHEEARMLINEQNITKFDSMEMLKQRLRSLK